jgi:hypothetical protein
MHRDAKFYLRMTVLVVFVLIIGGYSYFQARKLIGGPQIVIESPQNGSTVTESFIEVKGKANNIKEISLDDRPIFIDEEGNFSEKLLLPPGLVIISMKAKDRFGRTTQEILSLYYAATSTLATTTPQSSGSTTRSSF